MNVDGTTATACQRREIAERLGVCHVTERKVLMGHRDVEGFVGTDDKKDTRVGATFVHLAGGVQITRADFET